MVVPHVSAVADAPVSSIATAMLFGTITFATVALATRTWLIGDSRAILSAMRPRAQPLDIQSFSSIYTLLHQCTFFGMILFFAYLCENHPFYPHEEKVYDRDQFFFLIGLLFIVSCYTVQKNDKSSSQRRVGISSNSSKLGEKLQALSKKPAKASSGEKEQSVSRREKANDVSSYSSFYTGTVITTGNYIHVNDAKPCNDVLNRDQTEEWKGWMQFIFLIYHYFHAEEVYNSIRIMITCYVWMTGFGNFSFFYLKNDYSAVRVIQMLWRLNFLVAFLCLSQGTTYILYYICPLHTYFFLMVYATMSIGRRLNYSKYGLRIKLSAVAFIVFLIWDVDSGLFRLIHFLFVWKQPTLGAINGTMWEWYFRTTLDHWSTFFGMVFAANYPITSLFYRKLEALPPSKCWTGKLSIGIPLAAVFIGWVKGPFMLEKYEYNMTNPYFGFLPLITYIYFRNLTPALRSHNLRLLHEIGKTTLETYLMQHHIWLSSNSKTILVFIPGWPKVNMMVVTILYFYISRKLYRLTLFLRGMILPDDLKKCLRSLAAMISAIVMFYALATYLNFLGVVTLKVVGIVSVICGILLYQTIMDTTWVTYVSAETNDEMSHADTFFSGHVIGTDSYVAKSFPPIISGMVLLIIGITWQGLAVKGAGKVVPLHSGCGNLVNRGHWIPVDGCNEAAHGVAYRNNNIQNFATCQPAGAGYTWGWETFPSSTRCHFTQRSEKRLKKWLSRRRLVFVGDSITRNMYHAVSRQFGIENAGLYDTTGPKHVDIGRSADKTQIDFRWAPMASEQVDTMTEIVKDAREKDVSKYDLIVMGGGMWDRLHRYSDQAAKAAHVEQISALVELVGSARKLGIPFVWITPTTINTPALNTPEKRDHMTEEDIADMRNVYETQGVIKSASFVIDGPSFTKERVNECFDGVHYPQDIYDAGAQILANAFDWLLPDQEIKEQFTAPEPGKMARPFLGFMMLCLCFIGLYFFDGFFGFSYIACVFVKGILPSDLFSEAFSVLHEKSMLPPLTFGSGGSTLSESTQENKNTNSKSPTDANDESPNTKQPAEYAEYAATVDEELADLFGESDTIELSRRYK